MGGFRSERAKSCLKLRRSIFGSLRDWDQDGMLDHWELINGLDPEESADSNEDKDGGGYTNVEAYFNSLCPAL
ncbi:hypothetical protein N8494_01735 [bacterium]|jgi:hypothetical protein|nr:hypothetical protein [bacterium]